MKTYKASCHCKSVKFEATWDLKRGIHKCNCTYCFKTQYQKAFVKTSEFKLLQGEVLLVNYHAEPSNWPEGNIHHYFCKNCGVQVYSKAFLELPGHPIFNGWFFCVNLATFDNITPEEIIAAPKNYENGLADDAMNPPEETRHL